MLGVSRLLSGSVTEADALRYQRQSKALPPHLLHYSEDKKPVVVWTSTRRCNLHCAHCYTDSFDREYPDELTTDEALAMVDALATFGSPVLLISGGEPLRRPDLPAVAAHAVSRGMRVVISTNGTLMTPERANEFAQIGVSYVGISIDGRPETHDRFRGMKGAFEASMRGIDACQQAGIKVGLRFTLTKPNRADLPWLFDLMVERDVRRLCIYHLAPTGRGAKIGKFTPSATETREALDLIFDTGVYADRDLNDRPKVVLLDLKLPKVDGLEVLRRIKSDERTKVIPVVVLTSSQEERDIVESYELGVNSYMVKPVDFDQFIDCVSELGLYWLVCNKPLA